MRTLLGVDVLSHNRWDCSVTVWYVKYVIQFQTALCKHCRREHWHQPTRMTSVWYCQYGLAGKDRVRKEGGGGRLCQNYAYSFFSYRNYMGGLDWMTFDPTDLPLSNHVLSTVPNTSVLVRRLMFDVSASLRDLTQAACPPTLPAEQVWKNPYRTPTPTHQWTPWQGFTLSSVTEGGDRKSTRLNSSHL